MWIYIVITFLSEGWSLAQGYTNSNTSVDSNSTASTLKVFVNRKAVYNLGSTVELQCSNRTWNKTMYVVWNIELKHKTCKISVSDDGKSEDSCNDGKSLQNNSIGQSYLHIPNFSTSDVGAYKCESVYTGGNENYIIEVDVTGYTNSNTSVDSNSTASTLKVFVNRKAVYNLGSTVELQCSNRTWNKTMYVVWNIELKHKTCKISVSDDGKSEDSCNDGKSLQNNSIGQSYLHIPNFSTSDVGAYKCESVYTGGNENYIIEVDVTAPPDVSAWLELESNKMVAVCRAERGKPAANISWSLAGNDSVTQQQDPDGSVTVESQLELSEHMDPENLTCIVRHQFWVQEKTLVPKLREANSSKLWIRIVLVLIIMISATFILLLKNGYVKSETSQTNSSPGIMS